MKAKYITESLETLLEYELPNEFCVVRLFSRWNILPFAPIFPCTKKILKNP